MHVGGLAENAHVGQDSVIHEVVRAVSIAAVLFAFKFTPLRFFDFAGDGGNDDISPHAHSRALQRFHGVGIADKRSLHVVDAAAVDETVFDDGARLVSYAGKKFFLYTVYGIHGAAV